MSQVFKGSVDEYKNIAALMEKIVNVREFNSKKISKELVENLFRAFSYGPSLANQQPWECLLINEGQKKEIIRATLDPFLTKDSYNGQPWIAGAPLVFIVLVDNRRAQARLGEVGKMFAIQDTFSALQNLRIVAHLQGLATSVAREFDYECLKKILQIPVAYEPIAIVAVGYSEKEVELPPRFNIKDFVHRERIT